MPELPEVETVARGLQTALGGGRIAELHHLRAGIFHAGNEVPRGSWAERMHGRRIDAVGRRAKWLIIDLDGWWWLIHLRMTGRMLVTDLAVPRPKHTHLEMAVALAEGGRRLLRFVDPRRFGRMLLTRQDPRSIPEGAAGVLGRLGPEPLELDAAGFIARCRMRARRQLKALLLDQTFLAGLGNIYVDESLFLAGLPPQACVATLNDRQLAGLHGSIQAVLAKAIRLGGTSMRDYIHPDGSYGAYHENFLAYGRAGEPCRVCARPLTLTRIQQRATVFCRRCQKARGGRGPIPIP